MRELLIEKWIEPSLISEKGDMYWLNKYGELHSFNDSPAAIFATEYKGWYKNGQLHRDGNKPSMIWSNGDKWWYKNGEFIK